MTACGAAAARAAYKHEKLPPENLPRFSSLRFIQTERKTRFLSYQSAKEGADGACGLAEGAVLLKQEGDELVRLWRTLQARWCLHLGRSRQLPEQADLHL